MGRHRRPRLYEEVLLLALKDESGTIELGTNYTFAVGGAVLAELLLEGRIAVDEGKKNKLVNARSATPIGDRLLDETLARIRRAKRRASVQTWVARIGNRRDLKHEIARGLCDRGILRAERGKVLLVFERRIYPELDPVPERELIERLRAAVTGETREVDPRTAVLIALAHPTGLLKSALGAEEVRRGKARIDEIAAGEVVGRATREAVEAMQAMIFLTTIYLPTLVAVT